MNSDFRLPPYGGPVPQSGTDEGTRRREAEKHMSPPRVADNVNHPSHYIAPNGMEVIDVIEGFGLQKNFLLANCVKYILRHPNKGGLEDLRKAQWYLNRAVDRAEMLDSAKIDTPTHTEGQYQNILFDLKHIRELIVKYCQGDELSPKNIITQIADILDRK